MNHPNLIYNENINNNNNNNKPNSSSSSSSRLPQSKQSQQPNRIPMNKNKVPTSSMINDNWNHLEQRHQTTRHSFRFEESCPTVPVATTTPLVSKLPTNQKKSAINSHFFGLGHQNHPSTKRQSNSNSNHALNLMMNSSSGSDRSSSPEDGATGDLQSNYPHSNQIHFLLETWLENEFQTNFKQLSRLIRNDRRETAIGSGNNSHNNNNGNSSKHQRYSSIDGADRSYLKLKSFHHHIVDEDHSLDCMDIEMEPEIFFIRKHDSEDDDIMIGDRSPDDKENNEDDEGWGVDATTTTTPSTGFQLGSNYLHLTNWLLQRRQIGSDGSVATAVNRENSKKFPWNKSAAAAAAVAPSRDIKNKTKESDTHSKLLSKRSRRRKVATVESPINVEIQQQNQNQNSWLTERLDYIEKCMMKPKRDDATGSTKNNQKSWTMEENLICLVLSKPDDRSNRDSLIYSYPSLGPPPIDSRSQQQSDSSSTSTSKVSKLAKVSGMFITLYEVMNLLTPSNPFETLQLSTVDILDRVLSPSPQPDGAASQPVSCKYYISFVIESVKLKSSGDSAIPLMLLLALPCDKFTELDCRAVAELVSNTLHVRFGSLAAAFSSFFFMSSPNSNNFSLTNSSRYLNRILATFETLLATKLSSSTSSPSSSSYSSTLKSSTLKNNTNFIESLLSLSNTFFVPKQSNLGQHSSFHTALVAQQLSVDESTALHLSNYLNDFDSLDWLDESIAFYKDGDDIERSLSEHFARCLQLDSVTSTSAAAMSTGPSTANNRSPNKSTSLFTENSQLFDLLELDLSSFVVIGSCLFYRGLFVQSHLSPIYLNSIRQILFGRGLLAASKHHPYDLVYFSRFYPTEEPSSTDSQFYNSKQQTTSELSHQFLLVIGYGHLLHCSLVNVHCFDRFYYRYLSDYRNHDGSQIDPKLEQQFPRFSPTANSSSLQLPSSFAFYVFIKESFRLLCLYLERFEFLTQLSDAFRLGQQVSTSNFVKSFSVASKHSKKKKHHHLVMKKRIKKLKSFLGLSSNNNNNNSHHNDPNNHENCDSKNKSLQSSQPPPPVNIGPDSRSLNQGPRNYGNGQKSRINSTSSQPCSCASDRSSSVSTSSSVDSSTLYSSSNTSSMNSLSTNSIQSVATLDSLSILTCTNNSSIHRFSHDFLPESLICYLSIDLAQQLETFHGPILEAFDLDSFQTEGSNENENQNGGGAKMADCADFQQHHSNLMANITSDLCQSIQQLRSTMRKQTLLSLKRRRRARVGSDGPATANTQGQQGTSTTSGRVIKLRYNCAKDPQSSGTTTATTTTTSILFRFYLLGRCSIVDSPDQSGIQRIGDEFYACFKLNSVPDSLSSSSSSSKHHRNSQRLSRWSFAGFGRNDERLAKAASSRVSDLDGLIVTSKKSFTSSAVDGQEDSSELDSFDETKFLSMDYGGGGAASNMGHGDRSQQYEQSRLDFLRIDLDELIQSVRLRNWH